MTGKRRGRREINPKSGRIAEKRADSHEAAVGRKAMTGYDRKAITGYCGKATTGYGGRAAMRYGRKAVTGYCVFGEKALK